MNNSEKNALPGEVDDDNESELRQAVQPDVVYGDTDLNPNQDDQADMNRAEPDEHF
jgi:hypothetical protein